MSKCQEIQSNLFDLVEQAATGKLPDEVAAHLRSCSRCAALFAEYTPLLAQLNQPEQPVPDSLWRSVQAQTNALAEVKTGGLLRTVFAGGKLAFSFKSALLVVAAAAGVYLGSGLGDNQTSYAETLADNYATLLTDYSSSPIADSYLGIEWSDTEEAGQ